MRKLIMVFLLFLFSLTLLPLFFFSTTTASFSNIFTVIPVLLVFIFPFFIGLLLFIYKIINFFITNQKVTSKKAIEKKETEENL